MSRFSDLLISKFIIARTPQEMIDYYTEKVFYGALSSDKFENMLELNYSVKSMVDTYKSRKDEAGLNEFVNFIRRRIREIISKITEGLAGENLLAYEEFVLFKCSDKRLPEDMENITQTLKAYDQLKKTSIQGFRKDIQSFGSFTELQNYLQPWMGEIEKQKYLMNPEYLQKHQQTEGAVTVLEDGPFKVVKIVSAEASADLCRNTGWCVKDPKYFEHYNISASNPLYLISKNGYKYALIDFDSSQFKDPQDRGATEEMAKEVYPLIVKMGLVDKITVGGDFKVFMVIPEAKNHVEGNITKSIQEFSKTADEYDKVSELYRNSGQHNQMGVVEFKKAQNEFYLKKQRIVSGMTTLAYTLGRSLTIESGFQNFINSITTRQGITTGMVFVSDYASSVNYFFSSKMDDLENMIHSEDEDNTHLEPTYEKMREEKNNFNNVIINNLELAIQKRGKDLGLNVRF